MTTLYIVLGGCALVILAAAMWRWDTRQAAKAQAKLDQAKKDQDARRKHEEAGEDWDASGGLAGSMSEPKQPADVS